MVRWLANIIADDLKGMSYAIVLSYHVSLHGMNLPRVYATDLAV